MEKQKTIFESEEKYLQHARNVLCDQKYQHNPLMVEFAALFESYERMFRQFSRTIRISDYQQNRLNELSKELTALNVSKDKFFSIISHDLRGQFASLLGLIELLHDKTGVDESKEAVSNLIKHAYSSARNLNALLENLLTWSKIQRGMTECCPENLEIGNIINANISLFAGQAAGKQILLKSYAACGALIYADYNVVNTVFRNLISNAIKFTNPGGVIEISARIYDETAIEFAVSDTGVGISQEDISKLFRIDNQSAKVGTSGELGTGLGLILCKELLDKSNGKIWVESGIGKGTTVRFTLPGTQSDEKSAGSVLKHSFSTPAADQEKYRMLVVDDAPEEILSNIIFSPEAKMRLPEIITGLETEILPRWKELHEIFFINDIADFASEITRFAIEYHLDFLKDYAQHLSDYVKRNEILEIEKQMSLFPKLADKIIKTANKDLSL